MDSIYDKPEVKKPTPFDKIPASLKTVALVHFIFMLMIGFLLFVTPRAFMEFIELEDGSVMMTRFSSSGFFLAAAVSMIVRSQTRHLASKWLIALSIWSAIITISFYVNIIETKSWDGFFLGSINCFFLVVWLYYNGQFQELEQDFTDETNKKDNNDSIF